MKHTSTLFAKGNNEALALSERDDAHVPKTEDKKVRSAQSELSRKSEVANNNEVVNSDDELQQAIDHRTEMKKMIIKPE